MELRHLRYFIAVAEEGSLTVAAQNRLHTSQPSLSRQIRALEQEVGTPLFTRSAHGIELTPAGRIFLDHARISVQQAEAGAEAARRAALPERASVSLGFLSGIEIDLLPHVLRVLQDELPKIEVKLTSDYSPRLANGVKTGRLDAAFMRREPNPGGLAYKHVRDDPFLVFCAKNHRLASRKTIALSDLRGEVLIKPSKTAPVVRNAVESALRRSDVDVRAHQEVHNLAHAFAMILSTGGVTLLPAYAYKYVPHSIASRPIKGDSPLIELVFGYRTAGITPATKLLLAQLDSFGTKPRRR